MVGGDQDVGKGFVIAQQHVVAGFQLLDEVLFQEQRLGFGARGQEHHRRCLKNHLGNAAGMAGGAGIVGDPRLEVARLADVQHFALGVEHPVNAGRAVKRFQIGLDHLMAGGWGRGRGHGCGLSGGGDSGRGCNDRRAAGKRKAVHSFCG